jgi:hypothetical protein
MTNKVSVFDMPAARVEEIKRQWARLVQKVLTS